MDESQQMTTSASTTTSTAKPPVWLIGLLSALVAIGGYVVLHDQQLNQASDPLVSQLSDIKLVTDLAAEPLPTRSSSTSKVSNQPIADSLISQTAIREGIGIGYTTKPAAPITVRAGVARAAAQDSAYRPTLWYTKFVNKTSEIFAYDITTRQETQITKADGQRHDQPVFSSVSQRLAYQSSLTDNPTDDGQTTYTECSLQILDFAQNNQLIKTLASPDRCYQPVAWSPDGDRLVILQTDKRPQEMYLYGRKDSGVYTNNEAFMIYSVAANAAEVFPHPEVGSFCRFATWISNTEVIGECVSTGRLLYRYRLGSGSAEPESVEYPNPRNYSVTDHWIFYQTTETPSSEVTAEVAMQLLSDPAQSLIIQGSGPTYDFLPAYDPAYAEDEDDPSSIVISRVRNSVEYELEEGIFSVDLETGASIKRLATSGVSFIGWVGDYQHLLYKAAPGGSGATAEEYRLLDFATGQDETVLRIPFSELYERYQ